MLSSSNVGKQITFHIDENCMVLFINTTENSYYKQCTKDILKSKLHFAIHDSKISGWE